MWAKTHRVVAAQGAAIDTWVFASFRVWRSHLRSNPVPRSPFPITVPRSPSSTHGIAICVQEWQNLPAFNGTLPSS